MNDPSEQLLDDDAELRRAIRRVRGGHIANEALRSRIEQSLQTETATASAPAQANRPAASPWTRWAGRLAIAACFLVAGGVLERVRHKAEERREYSEANHGLLVAMVKAHAQPPADFQPLADVTDPQHVRDELATRLSRKPPLPDLSALGWSLKQAGVESLSGAVTARAGFIHNDQHATLFSLPQFAMAGADDGFTYDMTVDGHPISGYVNANGVHCIVGDAGVPLSDITALRIALQKKSQDSTAG